MSGKPSRRKVQRRAVRRITGACERAWTSAWTRLRGGPERPAVTLDVMQRRLELLLAALYGRSMHVDATEPTVRAGVVRRVLDGVPRHLRRSEAPASTDGERIRLPRSVSGDAHTARSWYRLLTIEQAERIARGTATLLPADDALLERDLYLLSEGEAMDQYIAHAIPGLRDMLAGARAAALAHRPPLGVLTPLERGVEMMLRGMLERAAATPHDAAPTPADSLAWAERTSAELRTRVPHGRYRGIALVAHWGLVTRMAADVDRADPTGEVKQTTADVRRPRRKHFRPITSSPESTQFMAAVEDAKGPPSGDATASEDERATEGALSDDGNRVMDESEAEPGQSAGGAGTDALRERGPRAPAAPVRTDYPEWDFNLGAYRPRGATVVAYSAPESSDGWAAATLRERAVLARQVRAQFERLRARRLRLPRQQDGDELDIAACVNALVDRRMGRAPDDRLYVAVHPARQALAIALLVDVSGSTNASVAHPRSDLQHVIEVEKTALLLASEALDALGDRYAILTFASHGAADVRVGAIKHFAERNGDAVRGRISAIEPEGNTRLGAAIRHATALLAEQPVGHRLLLLLSDGKPSDTDRYFEAYGVEDTRRAILEARTAGVFPFCLAVHSEQPPAYLSHIFGPTGHTVLSQPDHLPAALLRVIRNLLGAR